MKGGSGTAAGCSLGKEKGMRTWLHHLRQGVHAKKPVRQHFPGLKVDGGFIDEFDTNGNFIRRFATRGLLNSPIGAAIAPAGFGQFGGDVLCGLARLAVLGGSVVRVSSSKELLHGTHLVAQAVFTRAIESSPRLSSSSCPAAADA
jgi:hypothetical protein